MRGWGGVALALALAVALAACKASTRQKREGDAAPADIVAAPIYTDGGTTSHGGAAGGPTADEVEPNDGADTATPLTLGGGVRGTLGLDGDVDYFRLDVSEAGVLAITLPAVDADLAVELLDPSLKSIARSDRAGKRGEEGIPDVGVAPGRYTVVVRGKKPPAVKVVPAKPPRTKRGKHPAKGKPADVGVPPAPVAAPASAMPGVAYELTAALVTPAAGAEHEPNDDRGTAAELIVGETVTGYLGWTGDVDTWKLSVEALGATNVLDLEATAVDGLTLTLEVADALGKPVATRRGAKGAAVVAAGLGLAVAAGAPPFVYVTVKSDRSNPVTTYSLRATEKPAVEDADREPNDTPERAMEFPADRVEVTGTWAIGDVDYFAVPPSDAARTLEATLDTQDRADFAIELLVDDKSIAKGDGGTGHAAHVSGPVPAGARALLRVRASDASAPATYSVKLHDAPAAP